MIIKCLAAKIDLGLMDDFGILHLTSHYWALLVKMCALSQPNYSSMQCENTVLLQLTEHWTWLEQRCNLGGAHWSSRHWHLSLFWRARREKGSHVWYYHVNNTNQNLVCSHSSDFDEETTAKLIMKEWSSI